MCIKIFFSFLFILLCALPCISQSDSARNICLDETADDFRLSVQHFGKLIAQDSSDLDAIHSLGMSYYKLRVYDKAISTFSLLIARDECHLNPLNNRGLSKYLLGDKEGACEDLAESLKCKMKSKEKKSAKKQFTELCKT